jgi:hypothetical protein
MVLGSYLLSSMTSALTRCHLSLASAHFFWYLSFPTILSAVSCARPAPDHEWMVQPSIWTDAMPVEAVTATASLLCLYFSWRCAIMAPRRYDLPVPVIDINSCFEEKKVIRPADPVKKTLFPDFIRSRTSSCSSDKDAKSTGGLEGEGAKEVVEERGGDGEAGSVLS